MNARAISIAQLLMAGALWSLAGIFIKMIEMNPLAIASARSLIAALMLFLFLGGRPNFTFSRPQIIGALCNTGTMLLFVAANKYTTAANAILLQYGAPIYVVFMSYFILKEKIKWYDYVATAGVAVGMLLFFGESVTGGGMLGNIMAVASGVTFAGQAICLRLQKNASGFETILLGNIFSAVIGLPFLLFAIPAAIAGAVPLLLLGVFQLGLPYILYSKAARSATALDLILIPMVEPLLNPLWVFIGTGEKPGTLTFIGGGCIIAMVLFKSYFAIRGSGRSSCSS